MDAVGWVALQQQGATQWPALTNTNYVQTAAGPSGTTVVAVWLPYFIQVAQSQGFYKATPYQVVTDASGNPASVQLTNQIDIAMNVAINGEAQPLAPSHCTETLQRSIRPWAQHHTGVLLAWCAGYADPQVYSLEQCLSGSYM